MSLRRMIKRAKIPAPTDTPRERQGYVGHLVPFGAAALRPHSTWWPRVATAYQLTREDPRTSPSRSLRRAPRRALSAGSSPSSCALSTCADSNIAKEQSDS
jgi:hypothetical protein